MMPIAHQAPAPTTAAVPYLPASIPQRPSTAESVAAAAPVVVLRNAASPPPPSKGSQTARLRMTRDEERASSPTRQAIHDYQPHLQQQQQQQPQSQQQYLHSSFGTAPAAAFSPTPLAHHLNQNMLLNAASSKHPLPPSVLHSPLTPRVAAAMQQHCLQTSRRLSQEAMQVSGGGGGGVMYPIMALTEQQQRSVSPNRGVRVASPTLYQQQQHQQQQQAYHHPSPTLPHSHSHLELPPEFVAQQTQKRLLEHQQLFQAQYQLQHQQQFNPFMYAHGKGSEQDEKSQFLGRHSHHPHSPHRAHAHPHNSSTNLFQPSGQLIATERISTRIPRSSTKHNYQPSKIHDIGYENMKRRDRILLKQLKKRSEKSERIANVQLEMRGSVRFDMSNPEAIFKEVESQINKQPLTNQDTIHDYNEKRVVKMKDGTYVTIFGRIHERPDQVRQASISQFFLQKEESSMPSLYKYVKENYMRDKTRLKNSVGTGVAINNTAGGGSTTSPIRKRIERSDDELLTLSDDILTPLEKWKRDQLRQKIQKQEAQENAIREHRQKQNEALRARLERERFEREEDEKAEKELQERQAKEEEERLQREQERQRVYGEYIRTQAEEAKLARAELEARKIAAEAEEKRQIEERRKRLAFGVLNGAGPAGSSDPNSIVPSFMKPLNGKLIKDRSQIDGEDNLRARIKDTEKDYHISRAKLKAEVVRLEELIKKRERVAKRSAGLNGGSIFPTDEDTSITGLKDAEFHTALRQLHRSGDLIPTEDMKLRELEKHENECKQAYEKAMKDLDALYESRGEKEAAAASGGADAANGTTIPSPQQSGRPKKGVVILASSQSQKFIPPSDDSTTTTTAIDESSNQSVEAKARASRRATRVAAVDGKMKTPATTTSAGKSTEGANLTQATDQSRTSSRTHSPAATPPMRSRRTSQDENAIANNLNATSAATTAATGATSEHEARRSSVTNSTGSGSGSHSQKGSQSGSPIVNARTLAIDAARAQMSSQQADFEARIKALTSFSSTKKGGATSASPSNKEKRKTSVTVTAAGKGKANSRKSNKRTTNVAPLNNLALTSGNTTNNSTGPSTHTSPPTTHGVIAQHVVSPDDGGEEEAEDAKLARSLKAQA